MKRKKDFMCLITAKDVILESQPRKQEHFLHLPMVNLNEEKICLPLAINVVMKYWGKEIPVGVAEELSKKYQKTKGAIIMEGLELAEKYGFTSYIYKSSLRDLKRRIDQGIPPIVILPGIQQIVQHATIVSGYDSEERRILTYVPKPDTLGAVPETKFETDWKQDDTIMIILVPDDMRDLFRNEDLMFKDSNRMCFEAERLREQDRNQESIESLRKAIELDDENAHAWSLLAGMYNELNLDEAVSCYEKAIVHNPKNYLAYRGLGNYYMKAGDYSLCEAYYTKAIDINPSRFGPIYKNRAVARMHLNNNEGAKQDLMQYLEQTPSAQDKKSVEDALIEMSSEKDLL